MQTNPHRRAGNLKGSRQRVNVSGMVSEVTDLSLSDTTRVSFISVKTKSGNIVLQRAESTGPMGLIDLRPFIVRGPIDMVAASWCCARRSAAASSSD